MKLEILFGNRTGSFIPRQNIKELREIGSVNLIPPGCWITHTVEAELPDD